MTAATLSVTSAPDASGVLPLHVLPRGARASIVELRQPQDADERELLLRLIEIGFLPGETLRVVARAAGGEPIAVRLGGQSTFALRQREAGLVLVQPFDGAQAAA
jgi:ferrous iron transport protein A